MTVIDFPGNTKGPVSVESVCEGAKECEEVFVLGWDKDGSLYAASSSGQVGDVILLFEVWKHNFLSGHYGQ